MHIVEQIFWLFFAAIAAFIAWGAISMWLGRLRRESEVPSPSRRNATFGTGSLDSTAAGFATVDISGSASESTAGESASGDSGGGESGGGDFSGGGGESGGGGSSGSW